MKRVLYHALFLTIIFACLAGTALAQTSEKPEWTTCFKAHDRNSDGKIDRGEYKEWMTEVFFHRDRNHKGYLVFEDVRDVMSPETFKAADANGEGKLTLQEFLGAVSQDFDAADLNKDGVLTEEEMDAYVKRPGK